MNSIKYRGVIIRQEKEIVPWSDMRELKDGRIIPRKPEYEVSWRYVDSYPYPTKQEAKDAVDRIFACAAAKGISEEEVVEIMNQGE